MHVFCIRSLLADMLSVRKNRRQLLFKSMCRFGSVLYLSRIHTRISPTLLLDQA